MKKILKLTTILALSALVIGSMAGCGKTADKAQDEKSAIMVSATSVPHAEILEHIQPELEKRGVTMEISVADDFDVHNRSLHENEVDANFFQHIPFLEEQIDAFNYDIREFGKIHIEPLGVYSKKFGSLEDIPDGATISIPNDPTNESRALALLHNNGLIEMKDLTDLSATIIDIKANPRNLKFKEIDAAMLARTLDDVDASVINTNFALAANLDPLGDALAMEDEKSPNVNVLTIRNGDEEREELLILQEVLMSDLVRDFILDKYEGAVVPVF